MRYSTALVLSTLAIGQAAASNARHASFHARRHAKRNYDNVDWTKVSYDLSGVDWNKVFATPTAEPKKEETPAPQVEAAKEEPKKEEAPVEEVAVSTNSITDVIDDVVDGIGNLVGDILHGVDDIFGKMGISGQGENAKDSSANIWIGGDSNWKTKFVNTAGRDMVVVCWEAKGFSGMSLNVNKPAISVGLKPGEEVEVSWKENVPSACAPAFDDSKLAMFGGIDDTWYEVTFNSMGAFDISRNINMNGNNISAQGSKCKSDMNTCYFGCKHGMTSCEKGSDYDLFNCDAGNGGGGGFDPVMAGTGGGCSMGSDGETVTVSF